MRRHPKTTWGRKVSIKKAEKQLQDIVEQVRATNNAITLTNAKGDLVRIVPIPIPIGVRNGRQVYRIEDMQYLDVPPY